MSKMINVNSLSLSNGGQSSNIFSKIQSSYSNLTSTTIMIILFVTIFSAVSLYYYFYYVYPKIKTTYQANKEVMSEGSNGASGTNVAELLLFYVDWCPHCKTAKPIWNEIKSEYESKTINGYKIIFTEINCTTETAEVEQMVNKYNIEGYPTIKLLKDGQVIEYDAKPSKVTLEQFLNTVL
jgi:thiol-disulfide isomerase/thioredoxin